MAASDSSRLPEAAMDRVVRGLKAIMPYRELLDEGARGFVEDTMRRFRLYGDEMRLSAKQRKYLGLIQKKLRIRGAGREE
jgi:hypothetical protein